ncbi:hypothetical protein F4778DRAFT_802636 [Xylariomycetidae sp. FL2044]|nr:hypothetical protein F4778DRAFT_802636 [Xylariomycetidae sp. FL2044]
MASTDEIKMTPRDIERHRHEWREDHDAEVFRGLTASPKLVNGHPYHPHPYHHLDNFGSPSHSSSYLNTEMDRSNPLHTNHMIVHLCMVRGGYLVQCITQYFSDMKPWKNVPVNRFTLRVHQAVLNEVEGAYRVHRILPAVDKPYANSAVGAFVVEYCPWAAYEQRRWRKGRRNGPQPSPAGTMSQAPGPPEAFGLQADYEDKNPHL